MWTLWKFCLRSLRYVSLNVLLYYYWTKMKRSMMNSDVFQERRRNGGVASWSLTIRTFFVLHPRCYSTELILSIQQTRIYSSMPSGYTCKRNITCTRDARHLLHSCFGAIKAIHPLHPWYKYYEQTIGACSRPGLSGVPARQYIFQSWILLLSICRRFKEVL